MLCGCEVNAYIRSRTQCHIQKTLFKLQIHAATLECSKWRPKSPILQFHTLYATHGSRHDVQLGTNQHARERFKSYRTRLRIIEPVPTINMYETSALYLQCALFSALNQSLIGSACLSDFQFSSSFGAGSVLFFTCAACHPQEKITMCALEAEKSSASAMRDVYVESWPPCCCTDGWQCHGASEREIESKTIYISQKEALRVQLISLSGGSTPAAAGALFARSWLRL